MAAQETPTARKPQPSAGLFTVERAKAFIDAVVAIAMTLLILPLLEAVADGAADTFSPAHWFGEHLQQLISFVLSFALIAMFWVFHHRLFSEVDLISSGLLWLNVAWLLTIVWLPVATALIGRTPGTEPVGASAYVGSMILTSVLMLAMRIYLLRHPSMHGATELAIRSGIAAELAVILLFAVSLTVILVAPAIGYWALFLMVLVGPVQALFARPLHARG